MTSAQKIVADLMRNEVTHFNNFDGHKVADWLEANEDKWGSFYMADLNYPLLVLYQLPDNHYYADTLWVLVATLEDAQTIIEVAKTQWWADEAEVVSAEKCDALKYYCKDPLVRVWWD